MSYPSVCCHALDAIKEYLPVRRSKIKAVVDRHARLKGGFAAQIAAVLQNIERIRRKRLEMGTSALSEKIVLRVRLRTIPLEPPPRGNYLLCLKIRNAGEARRCKDRPVDVYAGTALQHV